MNLPNAVRRLVARMTPFVHADGLPVVRPASSPLRLLIVDDEDSVRVALSGLLRAIGHHAKVAVSGSDALALLRQEPFDIVLCDVLMPGMSGLEFLSQAIRFDPDVVVLMLTGVNEVDTATDALSRGALDYLVKPIEFGDLRNALERASLRRTSEMERRGAEGLAREAPPSREQDRARRPILG